MFDNLERVKLFETVKSAALKELAQFAVQGSVVGQDDLEAMVENSYPLMVKNDEIAVPQAEIDSNNLGVLILRDNDRITSINFRPYLSSLTPDAKSTLSMLPDIGIVDEVSAAFGDNFLPVLPHDKGAVTSSMGVRLYDEPGLEDDIILRSRAVVVVRATNLNTGTMIHEPAHEVFVRSALPEYKQIFTGNDFRRVAAWTERDSYRIEAQIAEQRGMLKPLDRDAAQNYLLSPLVAIDGGLRPEAGPANILRLTSAIDAALGHPTEFPKESEISHYDQYGFLS